MTDSSLLAMTHSELHRVCSITKNPEYLYTLPLSKIVTSILECSVETVQAWELVDMSFDTSPTVQFQYDTWFNWCDSGFDEMLLSLRIHNHHRGVEETLTIDLLQVIRKELQSKKDPLYISGAEIREGTDPIVVKGKALSLKNGMVRLAITPEKPSD